MWLQHMKFWYNKKQNGVIQMPRLKSEQIIVRLSPKLKRQLEKKAEDNQTTVSELVRFLIEMMLSKDNSSNTKESLDNKS